MELQGRLDQLTREGFGLAAVSYDPVPVLADFASRRGITFPLLSDEGSALIKRCGIFNTTVAPDSPTYGIPFPGTFILDAKGVVTSRFFEAAYSGAEHDHQRAGEAWREAGRDGDEDQRAAPDADDVCHRSNGGGGHAFLGRRRRGAGIARPRLRARGHRLQADRADDRRAPPPLVVRDAQFPKSEDYFFKPLNEHVAVYQRSFRIVQDLEIDPSPQAAAAIAERTLLPIAGTLTYQACDDKVCFTPQSVPLSWSIGLKPLDRERVRR